MDRQVIAHHFYSYRSEEFLQCVIYDPKGSEISVCSRKFSGEGVAIDSTDHGIGIEPEMFRIFSTLGIGRSSDSHELSIAEYPQTSQ
jgi:hypothetical protein